MAKPLHEFGGWLTFFKVYNLIVIVVVAIDIIDFLLSISESSSLLLPLIIVIIVETILFIFLVVQMLRILNNQSSEIPNKIKKLLLLILLLSIGFAVIEICIASSLPEKLISDLYLIPPLVQSIIYYFIWTSYFKKSKRVKAYYGANSGKPLADTT